MPQGTDAQAPWEGPDDSPNPEQPAPSRGAVQATDDVQLITPADEKVAEETRYPWGKETGCMSGN